MPVWNRSTATIPTRPSMDASRPATGLDGDEDRLRFRSESLLTRLVVGAGRLGWAALCPWVRRYGIVWRFRRQLVPFAGLAVTAGVGALVAGRGASAGVIVAVGLPAAVGAWLATRWWLDETRERVYAAVVLAAATVWLAGLAAYGWDQRVAGMRLAAWLLVVGMPAGVPWWWRFRHRGPGEPPAPHGDEGPPEEAEPLIVTEWDRYLSGPGQRFEGTRLTNVQPITEGETAEIILIRGKQKTSDVTLNAELIASAFDKPDSQAIAEPHPQGIKSRAKLTILHRDVLADVQLWAGSTLDPVTGIATVGRFPDSAPAAFRFWIPGDGAVMSLVAGATRMGKSAFLKLLLATTTDPNRPVPVSPWFFDCEDNGQSLTKWQRKLTYVARGAARSMLQLRALEQEALERSRAFSERGQDEFTPTEEHPLILAILDEIPVLTKHPLYKDEAVRILEFLAQRGAKRGVALVLVTQLPSLDEMDSQTLRSMLRSGNVVCFRTGDSVSGGMLGLQVDPAFLPEYFATGDPAKGLCILKGPDARQAPTRTVYIGDPDREQQVVDAAVEHPLTATEHDAYIEVMNRPEEEIDQYLGLATPPPAPQAEPEAAPGDQSDSRVAADAVLDLLGDGIQRSRAEVAVALRPVIPSLSTIGYALAQLKTDGLITQPAGERTPYVITDAGRTKLNLAA